MGQDIKHGTSRALKLHQEEGTNRCDECRAYWARVNRNYLARRKALGGRCFYKPNHSRVWVGGNLHIPAIGTARRAQALNALGHTWRDIAEHMGVKFQVVQQLARYRKYVTRETEQKIAEIYDRMSMTLPVQDAVHKKARTLAIEKGWLPPLAWDDDDIDDPAGLPSISFNSQQFKKWLKLAANEEAVKAYWAFERERKAQYAA